MRFPGPNQLQILRRGPLAQSGASASSEPGRPATPFPPPGAAPPPERDYDPIFSQYQHSAPSYSPPVPWFESVHVGPTPESRGPAPQVVSDDQMSYQPTPLSAAMMQALIDEARALNAESHGAASIDRAIAEMSRPGAELQAGVAAESALHDASPRLSELEQAIMIAGGAGQQQTEEAVHSEAMHAGMMQTAVDLGSPEPVQQLEMIQQMYELHHEQMMNPGMPPGM